MDTPPPQEPPVDAPAPQPAPDPNYMPPTGPAIRFDVIGQAFSMVFADIGTWVTAAVLMLLVILVVDGVVFFLIGLLGLTGLAAGSAGMIGVLLMASVSIFFVALVGQVLVANMYQMALIAVSGTKPSVNLMLKIPKNIPDILVASLVVAIILAIGTFLCYIPALIAGGLLMFTLPLIVDRKMQGMAAINRSVELLKKDWLMAAIFYFAVSFCAGIGSIACGIGVIFTLPILPISVALLYRDCVGIESSDAPATA